jgi:hypothetical protein
MMSKDSNVAGHPGAGKVKRTPAINRQEVLYGRLLNGKENRRPLEASLRKGADVNR